MAADLASKPFDSIVDEYADRFDGSFTRDEIQQLVDQSRADLAATNKIPQFLPVLVRRFVHDRLIHLAKDRGIDQHGLHDILFVCNGNAGRSQMAAAFANKLGAGRVRAWSAGINPHGAVLDDVITVMAEKDIDLTTSYSKPVTTDISRSADYTVAIGVPLDELPQMSKHTVEWDIPPVIGRDIETTRRTRDELESRVRALLDDILVVV